jgi:uncharacterized protein YegJ (DUF2314 family)
LSPNAPQDRPTEVTSRAKAREIEAAIAPYIEKARQTYPDAKRRYLETLPAGHRFFAVTRLRDGANREEQVFVAVTGITNGRIFGWIASDIQAVSKFRKGNSHSFAESELVDWLITRPDGTEEGNLVGKFFDTYQGAR